MLHRQSPALSPLEIAMSFQDLVLQLQRHLGEHFRLVLQPSRLKRRAKRWLHYLTSQNPKACRSQLARPLTDGHCPKWPMRQPLAIRESLVQKLWLGTRQLVLYGRAIATASSAPASFDSKKPAPPSPHHRQDTQEGSFSRSHVLTVLSFQAANTAREQQVRRQQEDKTQNTKVDPFCKSVMVMAVNELHHNNRPALAHRLLTGWQSGSHFVLLSTGG